MRSVRLVVMASLALLMASGLSPIQAGAKSTVAVVDTLGAAGTGTSFSVLGSGGLSILDTQHAGPEFVLDRKTFIVEIGAYVGRDPNASHTATRVEIRRSLDGRPDPTASLATFVLSGDRLPGVIAFEAVSLHLKLEAGTYFALFEPQGNDQAFVLGSAQDPFFYAADRVPTGFLDPTTGTSAFSPAELIAVRILGR